MGKLIVIILIFGLLFKPQLVMAQEKYVTIINPVRDRTFWQNMDLFNDQAQLITSQDLKSTWLPTYDVLSDYVVTNRFKELQDQGHEIGLFLEVSENLATAAQVSYLQGEGDYYRPDKVFLSGYTLQQRLLLIDEMFSQFKSIFGYYPTAVGAWYIDPFSLAYLENKYQVKTGLVCSDQWQTDKYQIWGQPWGVPFYPSKYNSLVPALDQAEKIDVVLIQWALRDADLAYGETVSHSTYSLQANDYLGHHQLNINYFKKVLDQYLSAGNPINQATVGLEVGEGRVMEEPVLAEYGRQIETVKQGGAQAVTMSEFGDIYMNRFDLMPDSKIEGENFTWINTIKQRYGIEQADGQKILKDWRVYQPTDFSPDLTSADQRPFLYRLIPAEVDEIGLKNSREIDYFPEKTEPGFSFKRWFEKIKTGLIQSMAKLDKKSYGGFKFSRIDGRIVAGIWYQPNQLLGIKTKPLEIGSFYYPFQSLVRFRGL